MQNAKNDYGVTFSEYLRGDPSSERFDYDVWLTIRFLNAWGHVLKHYPDSTHLLRYKSLTADPVRELEECCTHYGIRFKGTRAIEDAVTACTKDAMEKR